MRISVLTLVSFLCAFHTALSQEIDFEWGPVHEQEEGFITSECHISLVPDEFDADSYPMWRYGMDYMSYGEPAIINDKFLTGFGYSLFDINTLEIEHNFDEIDMEEETVVNRDTIYPRVDGDSKQVLFSPAIEHPLPGENDEYKYSFAVASPSKDRVCLMKVSDYTSWGNDPRDFKLKVMDINGEVSDFGAWDPSFLLNEKELKKDRKGTLVKERMSFFTLEESEADTYAQVVLTSVVYKLPIANGAIAFYGTKPEILGVLVRVFHMETGEMDFHFWKNEDETIYGEVSFEAKDLKDGKFRFGLHNREGARGKANSHQYHHSFALDIETGEFTKGVKLPMDEIEWYDNLELRRFRNRVNWMHRYHGDGFEYVMWNTEHSSWELIKAAAKENGIEILNAGEGGYCLAYLATDKQSGAMYLGCIPYPEDKGGNPIMIQTSPSKLKDQDRVLGAAVTYPITSERVYERILSLRLE